MAGKKTTKDPLLPFAEHHPVLLIGGFILFGAAIGRTLGSAADTVYRAAKHNDRGEYGRDGVRVGQRPQLPAKWLPIVDPDQHSEGPGAPIWRLNDRIQSYTFEIANTPRSEREWAKFNPIWKSEMLPFLREWGDFWRSDSTKWSWNDFDRWATRWNALSARVTKMFPRHEPAGGAHGHYQR